MALLNQQLCNIYETKWNNLANLPKGRGAEPPFRPYIIIEYFGKLIER